MKKNKKHTLRFILLLLMIALFQSCQSQTKENPKYLGEKNNSFDLEKITFNENVDTLFSKIPHVSLDRTNGKSKAWVFRNKLNDKSDNLNVVHFVDIYDNQLEVIANEDKKIQAFILFFETNKNPQKIINELEKKYSKYKVDIKPNKRLEFSNSKLYQWNLPDKIYAVTISDLGKEFTISVVVAKADITKNTMSLNLSPICLDKNCKK